MIGAWRGEDAKDVLHFYREFTASAPRELTCVAVLRRAPPAPWLSKELHGQHIAAVFVCHIGSVDEGEKLAAPLRAFGHPVADVVTRRPYTQMQSLLDATQPKGRRYYWKSNYLPALDAAAVDVLAEHAMRVRSAHSAIILFHLQGAIAELPADHCPMGNRDAAYVFNATGSWEDAADDAANIAWAREAFAAMQPFSTGGVYVNFLTEEEGRDRIEAAYSRATLEKLAALKRRFDPDDLFSHTKRVL